jgi:tetraacyldisaccharide 4'-kinase
VLKKLRFLLFPFAILYRLITGFRNHLYNIGHKKSHQFDVLTIGVGNLRVGGTGKTPISSYILNLLIDNNLNPSYLSRGYERKSKGFVKVKVDSNSDEVGDEALQMKKNFAHIPVSVCEDRVLGIPTILYEYPEVNAIVLDDIFQHRRVNPHLNILLTAYGDLFSDDYILPVGNLRENKRGAKRADLLIVTKCPELTDSERKDIRSQLKIYLKPNTEILFSSVQYKELETVLGIESDNRNMMLVSAIAANQSFYDHCVKNFSVKKHFTFRDHHNFSEAEIKEMINFSSSNNGIPWLTTEKDWQRLQKFEQLLIDNEQVVKVLPIEINLDNSKILEQKILEAAKNI